MLIPLDNTSYLTYIAYVFRQKYSFNTIWTFKTPKQKVWQLIDSVEDAPSWWPGIKKMQVSGSKTRIGVGSKIESQVRGLLGDLRFTMTITDIRPCDCVHLTCVGDLEGFGHVTLREKGSTTSVDYIWEVVTTRWFMNLFGLFLKPIFKASHNRLMKEGYRRLKILIED